MEAVLNPVYKVSAQSVFA